MFAAPAATVPLFVVLALTAHDLLDVARGRLKPSRLITVPANASFALAPAAVFVLARVEPAHAGPALLLAALLAQFAWDFAVSAARQSLDRGASLSAQLGELWVYAVDAGLSCVALGMALEAERAELAVLLLLPLLAILRFFAQERRARLESLLELRDAYRGTALVLGDVVEADDGYTGQHCKSVVALAVEVGSALGLDAERMRNLEFGALLHDVGKIAIPKEIINKPGKLDPSEWMLIKTHTVEGQNMLDRVGGFMREVGLIVRSHHERWDGEGYPDRLAGEAIPLEARIIACCDAWNAMRTDRSYREAMSFEAAMAEILASCGSQFDPRIVDALIAVVTDDEQHAAPSLAPGPAGPVAVLAS
jgi:putative nucleotidyltransferase with HDIG domain